MFAASASRVNANPKTQAAIARLRQQKVADAQEEHERLIRLGAARIETKIAEIQRMERERRRRAKTARILAIYEARSVEDLQDLAERICRSHSVRMVDLKSKRRTERILDARFCFCFWARRKTSHPFSIIGDFLGGRDHATVINAVNGHKERRQRRRQARKANGRTNHSS